MRGSPPVYGQPPSYRSALLWGALVGALALMFVVGMVLIGPREARYRPTGVPEQILAICAVQDVEGATVAGILAMIDSSGEIQVVDPEKEVVIPGTSYRTLKDAYAFGGGSAVAAALTGSDDDPVPAWVVLPEESWHMIIDDRGGVELDVESAVNAYVNGSLLAIDEGPQTLSGMELSVYLGSAPFAASPRAQERLTSSVVEVVGESIVAHWPVVVQMVRDGDASTPVPIDDLEAFSEK